MALFTISSARTAFAKWADDFVAEHGLSRAQNDGDEEKVLRIAKANLSDKEVDALMGYLFPQDVVKIKRKSKTSKVAKALRSTSNQATRRRRRKEAIDNVDGNRIKIDGPKIVRRLKGANVTKGQVLLQQPLSTEETKDEGQIADQTESEIDSVTVVTDKDKTHMDNLKVSASSERLPKAEKLSISLSGDVIFTPYTDGTQYACRRDATANLRRRMPDFNVMLSDVTGEGQIDFTVSTSLSLEGNEVALTARGIASPYEMAVHTISVNYGDKSLDINPTDRARSPEDTVLFLKRVALNCLTGKYGKAKV